MTSENEMSTIGQFNTYDDHVLAYFGSLTSFL